MVTVDLERCPRCDKAVYEAESAFAGTLDLTSVALTRGLHCSVLHTVTKDCELEPPRGPVSSPAPSQIDGAGIPGPAPGPGLRPAKGREVAWIWY